MNQDTPLEHPHRYSFTCRQFAFSLSPCLSHTHAYTHTHTHTHTHTSLYISLTHSHTHTHTHTHAHTHGFVCTAKLQGFLDNSDQWERECTPFFISIVCTSVLPILRGRNAPITFKAGEPKEVASDPTRKESCARADAISSL